MKDDEVKEVPLEKEHKTQKQLLFDYFAMAQATHARSWLQIPPSIWKQNGKVTSWTDEEYRLGRKDITRDIQEYPKLLSITSVQGKVKIKIQERITVLRETKMKWENLMMDLYGCKQDQRQIMFKIIITEGLNDDEPKSKEQLKGNKPNPKKGKQ
jgi:hypothetical protein